jgi:hypothetical protein
MQIAMQIGHELGNYDQIITKVMQKMHVSPANSPLVYVCRAGHIALQHTNGLKEIKKAWAHFRKMQLNGDHNVSTYIF